MRYATSLSSAGSLQQHDEAVPEQCLTCVVYDENVVEGGLHRVWAVGRHDTARYGHRVIGREEGRVEGVEAAGVEDGDDKPARVEDADELEHGADMALYSAMERQSSSGWARWRGSRTSGGWRSRRAFKGSCPWSSGVGTPRADLLSSLAVRSPSLGDVLTVNPEACLGGVLPVNPEASEQAAQL
jgi:hypothetical protein